jgi:hypothetical protein
MANPRESLRIARLLERLVLLKKYPIKKLERDLNVSSGYLFRVFSGRISLRFSHITDILEAIGIEPKTFFKMAYDMDDGSSGALFAEELRRQVSEVQLPEPLPSPDSADFEERVIEILSKLGVLQATSGGPAKAPHPRRKPKS